MNLNIKKTLEIIKQGTSEILLEKNLIDKLNKKTPLNIKFGCDPTSTDLHLGHTIILNKLSQLQNMGHNIYFLIGDFTAQIGDPTGKNITRPTLDSNQVKNNAKTYADQVFKILDKDKTKIIYNSSWFKSMYAIDIIKIASKQTVARMLEREDFSKRYKTNKAISIHEFIYPLIQGYDSVQINADIEIGGTDQKFNLLMGRELQKQVEQDPQVVITMPLLEGIDGTKKMSKSSNNFISINESPNQIFGKIMSISDNLMWRYYELLILDHEIIKSSKLFVEKGGNPKDIKIKLAKLIIERFYNKSSAEIAYKNFINQFQKKMIPDNLIEVTLSSNGENNIPIANILKKSGLVSSTSNALRMIEQGAVKINSIKISDRKMLIPCRSSNIYQVGKHKFMKINIS